MAQSSHEGQLSDDERAELERLRRQAAQHHGGAARGWRWVGASALLVVGAVIAALAVVGVYVRAEVLNTDTYVKTVTPLAQEPAVRDAVAHRLADEIVNRADVTGLANEAATQLESRGAPSQLSELVGPLVSGLNSFLYNQIHGFLGTQRFQDIWVTINREAHTGLVTVLTGQQGEFIKSQGDTVTLDIGALLSQAKQQLAAQGLTLVQKVPDVSISYTLLQSEELPTIRRYTRILNGVGTWLPWIALIVLVAGIAVAPHHRRGLIVAALLVGIVSALVLIAMSLARTYYLDHVPGGVSPDAVAEVYDTVVRFLVSALQALLTAAVLFFLVALAAGPSWLAVRVRRGLNWALDRLAALLSRTGSWAAAAGRAIARLRLPLQIGLVVLAVVVLVATGQVTAAAVLWTAVIVGILAALVELLIRADTRATTGTAAPVTAA